MPRKPLNDKAMSAAERQKKYREKHREWDQAQVSYKSRKIYAHNNYRLRINVMLERMSRFMNIMSLADKSGVPVHIIEAGEEKDCGIFYKKEIEALSRVLTQVPPPDRSLW